MRTWKIGFAFTLAMVLTIGLLTSLAQSQEKKPDGAAGGMPSPEEMQAMMEAMGKVGPEHKTLKEQFAGNWKADVTAYWGPTPEKSTGTMTSEMILGGRYVHGMYKGTAMGQPFEGAGLTGYDNIKKKYFNTWVDSMSTGVMNLEGDYDSASKTYTFTGETTGPDGKPCTMREVVKVDSNDKHTFTMYGPGMDGKEMKVMEIVYTRQK
jgi:hypothetical protein